MWSPSAEGWQSVSEWLGGLRLEQYSPAFQESGLRTVWECRQLTASQLEHMGVALPGHQKRILGSLHKQLSLERVITTEGEEEERKKPIPRGRTKFRAIAGTNSELNCLQNIPTDNPVTQKKGLPPIPPRVTHNCPPVRFSAVPVTEGMSTTDESVTRSVFTSLSLTEAIQPRHVPSPLPVPVRAPPRNLPLAMRRQTRDLKPSPVSQSAVSLSPVSPHHVSNSSSSSSSSSTEQFHLYEQCSSPGHAELGVPPLPPKSYVVVTTTEPKATPPARPPRRPPIPPRTTMPTPIKTTPLPRSLTAFGSSPADDLCGLDITDQTKPRAEPCLLAATSSVPYQRRDMFLPLPGVRKYWRSSLYSDDELLDEDDESVTEKRRSWIEEYNRLSSSQSSICLPTTGPVLTPPLRDDSTPQLSPVIKMGWLDKNPPQGSLIYQRRWVKLDADYLRYFDSDKEIVSSSHLKQISDLTLNPCVTSEMKGYLELRGLRSKLFTAVCGDKVFLYKNSEDYKLGIGITSIDMNVGNVKDMDRRAFDLTTPYRIFSFVAETDQLKNQWVEAMRNSIAEALSNYEVAEKIWAEPANQTCADCSATKPAWAAINLGVVFCKSCAGEHRSLGPSISKVRSLKMDKKVWTNDLIQLFLEVGNERANQFWAANIPPSEALTPFSSSDKRRRFITAKYREGKYRRYHPLFGNRQSSTTFGVSLGPSCWWFSVEAWRLLQQCCCGDGAVRTFVCFCSLESRKALCINVQSNDVCETLALVFCGADVNCDTGIPEFPTPTALALHHGQKLQVEFLTQNRNIGQYDHSFEIYSDAERLYLFGTDNPDSMKEWVKSIAKSFIPACAEDLLQKDFERIGRLRYKDPLNLESWRLGWFCLEASTLHVCLEDSESRESIQLQKLLELSRDNEVLVLVERGRTLYIEGERKLDFHCWVSAIQRAAGRSGDTLSQQQLTEADIPLIVERCIHYVTQYGLTSEGIYRKSGVNSRIASLLDSFRNDARSVWLKEGEHQVDDVSNVLKRFFRDIEEGLFGLQSHNWLSTTGNIHTHTHTHTHTV
ncbi:Arf-GAP with Rho-GAP domain, ANK repeat and PH domain-containing protein 1 [Bagarius yarrelli]|uniref:Arf-GAP with Rho-GAP domain, ANK repeat and PH domain-containing protein 1 n=1 Tax=Bagarius yarrelli TaxID=175774 RepID=A0A556VW31_BAGYA|nr:Arf-GAP with Rho-GAP domain, ANK repeat and PH domain-containing protein 1 [Bagarius yarrelli]